MPHLTICMPSHRDLEGSRHAIETALDYCNSRDAVLVVADNSADAMKKSYWKGRSEKLIYLDTVGQSSLENAMSAYRRAETPFILPMGDDDELLADAGKPGFDLASLPEDHIGVRPLTHVFADGAATRVKDYAIQGTEPADRITEYTELAGGDNSAYYSILRREPAIELFEFFATQHPTKGAYCDWAITTALFAYGKMAYDPSTVFRYNFDRWRTAGQLSDRKSEIYAEAGLPVDVDKYASLLLFLDVFIFVTRRKAPLSIDDKRKTSKAIVNLLLMAFIRQVRDNPGDYGETVAYLADLVMAETDSFAQFQIALLMADIAQPGLKDRYVSFFQQAMAA